MPRSPSSKVRFRGSWLRHKVDVYEEAGADSGDALDTLGQPSGPDDLVASGIHARIEPLSGSELEIARQEHSTVTHVITIRYQPSLSGLGPAHYFKWGSRKFYISSVINPEERNVALVCTCTEATG